MQSNYLKQEIIDKLNNDEKVCDLANEYGVPVSEILEIKELVATSKKIRNLIRLSKFEEALDICNNTIYMEERYIITQKITALTGLKRYEEALETCEKYYNINKSVIENQKKKIVKRVMGYNNEIYNEIVRLRKANKIDEALELCTDLRCNYHRGILYQRIILNLKRGNLEEALNLCNHERYRNDEQILNQRQRVIRMMEDRQLISNDAIPLVIKTELITKLYCDKLKKEEIVNSILLDWDKELFLIAYYDKNRDKSGIKLIKELKLKYKDDLDKIKVLNNLYNKLISKRNNFFDCVLYQEYLNCYVDFDSINNYKNSVEEEIVDNKLNNDKLTKPVTNNIEKKKKERQPVKMVEVIGVNMNSRYNEVNKSEKNNNDNKKVVANSDENILIKDLFEEEILEIGKYLYVQMKNNELREKAVMAWDRLQNLINKPASDKKYLLRMMDLLNRIGNNKSDVNIQLENGKIKKLTNM